MRYRSSKLPHTCGELELTLTLIALVLNSGARHLPYRQTEGFGRALVKLMGVDVAIPHHTSLQKRAAKLGITIEVARPDGAIDLVVDSTGLKVYGEGEWKVKKHGADGRRTWRKLHLAVDPDTHMIVAQSLPENNIHDGDQVEPLLEQVKSDVDTFYGDGAYDQWKVHDSLGKKNRGNHPATQERQDQAAWQLQRRDFAAR